MITVSGLLTSLKATINAREHKELIPTSALMTSVTESLTLHSSKKHRMLSAGQLLTMMMTKQTSGALTLVTKTLIAHLNVLPSSAQSGEISTP